MKIKILIFFYTALIFCTLTSYSQDIECSTIPKTEEEKELLPWYGNNDYLKYFADSIKLFERNKMYLNKTAVINEIPESNYKVPIQFWIYRDANGNDNGMDEIYIQQKLDEINHFYLINNTQIQFYSTCEIKYIDNDDYLKIDDDNEEKKIIRDNFTNGVINVHFVRDMVGSAGTFWQLISIEAIIIEQANSVGSPTSTTTFPHEVGHYFNLEHTHENYDKDKCLQEAVSRTRKFGLTCLKTGLICEKNGDTFCDTPADPLISDFGIINGMPDCIYTDLLLTDKWGDAYILNPPDVHNIMSYAADRRCRDFFSPSQSIAMVDKLIKRGYKHDNSNNIERFYFDRFEPDNTSTTARLIPLNTLQHHTFHWSHKDKNDLESCDVDWLFFEISNLNQGKLLQIFTDNGLFDYSDTELWIYKSNDLQNHIAYDDNSNNDGFSSIILENLAIGTYLIKVVNKTELPEKEIVDYTIMVRECVPFETCISGIVQSGVTKIYYARNQLTAPCPGENFVVETNAEVVFVSEVSINLEHGFHVENGAHFYTILEPIGSEACFNNPFETFKTYRIDDNITETIDFKNEIVGDSSIAIANDINLKIYPNPTSGTFTIEITLMNEDILNLSIYSLCGTLMKQVYTNQYFETGVHNIEINGNDFINGVYFCELLTKDKRLTKKIIIEK